MYPVQHLVFGAVFSLVLFLLFPEIEYFGMAIIILSTVLIDVDHYIYYVKKEKDFGIRNAYTWFLEKEKKFLQLPREKRNRFTPVFCFLHGIELLALVFVFSFFYRPLFFVFLGFSFHLLLDSVYGTTMFDRIDKVSLVNDYFRHRRLIGNV